MSGQLPHYIPGNLILSPEPLSRYLPPIADGVITQCLDAILIDTNNRKDGWILDPFGSSPRLAVEAARAGYRVVVAANNPISRYLIELVANPPDHEALRTALAVLASTRKGDERIEPHILALYQSRCTECERPVVVEAFIWEKRQSDNRPQENVAFHNHEIVAKVYKCSSCGLSGEFPASQADIDLAKRYSSSQLHTARALERVISINDPDRKNVAEALDVYLPRALYTIFTIINRFEALEISNSQRHALLGLLLNSCDLANTMWPQPAGRNRPRQLSTPTRFRENNVWLALEKSKEIFTKQQPAVHISHWPDLPPDHGGICLFDGKIKDLMEIINPEYCRAVVMIFPRPNQAFWSLSALWSGWLWGREAVGSFISVIRRRRYDWYWHTTALYAAISSIVQKTNSETPFVGFIGEGEPNFLSAVVLATSLAGLDLHDMHMRSDGQNFQFSWQKSQKDSYASTSQLIDISEAIKQAATKHLNAVGEPVPYIQIHAAVLKHLAIAQQFSNLGNGSAEIIGELNHKLGLVLNSPNRFLHYSSGGKSFDTGLWYLIDTSNASQPITDRIEKSLVQYMQKYPGSTFPSINRALCADFPGIFTPDELYLQVILESYADFDPENESWTLRKEDWSNSRQEDIVQITEILQQLGFKLGCTTEGQNPVIWKDQNGKTVYNFFIIASGIISDIINNSKYYPQQSIIVLPGGRANLVAYKIQKNPFIQQKIGAGWRLTKYRTIRWIAQNAILGSLNLDTLLAEDKLTFESPQLRMF